MQRRRAHDRVLEARAACRRQQLMCPDSVALHAQDGCGLAKDENGSVERPIDAAKVIERHEARGARTQRRKA